LSYLNYSSSSSKPSSGLASFCRWMKKKVFLSWNKTPRQKQFLHAKTGTSWQKKSQSVVFLQLQNNDI